MTWRTALRPAPALAPGLLMLAVALVGAGRPVLSWDEIATADVASRTPGQILPLMQHVDGVFGPYYLFIHFWTKVAGTSEVALRLPSALAMAGTVALTGELGRRLYGPGTGLLAGLLLALLPSASRYAAEARPYAFACFFALLAYLLLHVAAERGRAVWWVLYAVAVVLIGLSHLIALTTLAAHPLVLVGPGSRRTVRRWAAAAGPALLALAPMFWLGLHQRDDQLGWVPPLSATVLRHFPGEVTGSAAGGWLLLGFAVTALGRPLPHRASLVAMTAGPIGAVALLSWLVAPNWVPRYLLVVLAPTVLLAAAGLREVFRLPALDRPGRSPQAVASRVVVAPALLAFAVFPGQHAVREPDSKAGSDYRAAAAIVRHHQLPGDAVVYTAGSRTMRAGLTYYLRHDRTRPVDLLLTRTAAAASQLKAVESPPTAAALAGVDRLWLFVYRRNDDPLTGRPDLRAALDDHFRLDRVWFPRNETLALYVRTDRPPSR